MKVIPSPKILSCQWFILPANLTRRSLHVPDKIRRVKGQGARGKDMSFLITSQTDNLHMIATLDVQSAAQTASTARPLHER